MLLALVMILGVTAPAAFAITDANIDVAKTLVLGEPVRIENSANEQGRHFYFKFTPSQTDVYLLYSFDSSKDPDAIVWKDKDTRLSTFSNTGDFRGQLTLEAGKTYYIEVYNFGSLGYGCFSFALIQYHVFSSWEEENTIATCTQPGISTGYCNYCGATVERNTPALGHSVPYSGWTRTQEPTCSEEGIEEGTCSTCQETVTRNVPKTAHTVDLWTAVQSPTCVEPGSEEGECSVCGQTVIRSTEATGHSWGDWATTNEPTCTEDGSERRTCNNCDSEETRVVAALGHNWSEATSNGDGTHTQTCGRCSLTVDDEPCTYSTVKEGGFIKYTCDLCGYSYTESSATTNSVALWDFEQNTDGWAFTDADGDNNTWTHRTNSASYSHNSNSCLYSRYCMNTTVDNRAVSPAFSLAGLSNASLSLWARSHSTSTSEPFMLYAGTTNNFSEMTALTQEPIVTDTTYTEYTADLSAFAGQPEVYIAIRHCGVQDGWYLYVDDVAITYTIPAECDNHVLSFVPAVEQTCTSDGNAAYYVCSTCHRAYYDEEGTQPALPGDILFPAPGHNWSEWTATDEPTCLQAGSESRTCSRCQESETRTVAALGHDWGSWATEDAPTCTQAGSEKRTCNNCGSEETRVVAALGHDLSGEAVSGNDGTHTTVCGRCNESITEPCAYSRKVENGVARCTCTLCGYTYTEVTEEPGIIAFWDFEENAEGWNAIDLDGDGKSWTRYFNSSSNQYAHEGHGYFSSSFCYNTNVDNWAVSPAFSLTGMTNASLSFWAKANSSYSAEPFIIYAGTTGVPNEMTALTDVIEPTTTYDEYTADLSAFVGQPEVYIAIRHCEVQYGWYLYVDDVKISSESPAACDSHVLTLVPASEAACLTDALQEHYVCDTCGRLFLDAEGSQPVLYSDLITSAALGHAWGSWETANEASCTEEGSEIRACTRCQAAETRVTPALGHDFSGEAVSGNDGTHTKTCIRCSQELTELCIYEERTENGISKHTCTACGYSYIESVTGESLIEGWYFEGEADGWTFYDANEDGSCWELVDESDNSKYTAYEGSGLIRSSSYDSASGPCTPDNWAISPAFSLNGCAGATLSIYAGAADSTWSNEVFALYAGPADNMVKISDDITTEYGYINYRADFSRFAGQSDICVAIRHYNCNNEYHLLVDNVEIYGVMTADCEHELVLVPANDEATYTEGAHSVDFYRCSKCGRTYLDAQGAQPVLLSDITEGSALGHEWAVSGDWTWAGDYSSASVTIECGRCGAEQTLSTINITMLDIDDTRTYTANLDYDGETFSDSVTVTKRTVTFIDDAENNSVYDEYDAWGDVAISAPASDPEKDGYVFGGWYAPDAETYGWYFDDDGVYGMDVLNSETQIIEFIPAYEFLNNWSESGADSLFRLWDFENDKVSSDTVLFARWYAEQPVTVAAHSLTLNGDIGLNFYAAIENVRTDAYAVFTVDGKEVTCPVNLNDYTEENGVKYYKFSCNITPSQIDTEIYGIIYNGDTVSQPFSYSVHDYFDDLLADEELSNDANLVALAASIERYGYYANELFGYDDNFVQHSLFSDAGMNDITAEWLAQDQPVYDNTENGVSYYGSSLVLLTKTSFRHYFTLPEGKSIDDFAFSLSKSDDEEIPLTPVKKGSGYYVEISGIPAAEISKKQLVLVKDANGNVVNTWNASVLSYAYAALNANMSEALNNAVKALVLYYVASSNYFYSQP